MAINGVQVIDGDGHLVESLDDMMEYLDPHIRGWVSDEKSPLSMSRKSLFGTLDGIHFADAILGRPERERVDPSEERKGSAEDWIQLLDKSGIEQTVLFPTEGLSLGNIDLPSYAVSVCRAYNDYVAHRYQKVDRRQHPMALIPIQDPPAAARELRRAVRELGLIGAMLPCAPLPFHLGHEFYWPIYQEAADLDCVLGIHGGSNRGLGLGSFSSAVASHILHHPIPLMTTLVSYVYHGIWDRWPNLRVAFLEGGSAWVALVLDRSERDSEYMPSPKKSMHDHLASGNILIGCEGVDPTIPYLATRVGIEPFAYSTDYPHEVDFKSAVHEVEETLEDEGLTEIQKAAVLGGNTKRFFRL